MDFSGHNRPSSGYAPAEEKIRYWEILKKDDLAVGHTAQCNLKVLDLYKKKFTTKTGKTMFRYGLVVQRGDNHKYFEMSFWGGHVNINDNGDEVEDEDSMSEDLWDLCYLLNKQRPNCLKKEDLFKKLERITYPNVIGLYLSGVILCTDERGYYNGKVFEYKTNLSALELMNGSVDAEMIKSASAQLLSDWEAKKNGATKKKKPAKQPSYGGAQQVSKQELDPDVADAVSQLGEVEEPQRQKAADDEIPF